MAKKSTTSIGIDFDIRSLRAARIATDEVNGKKSSTIEQCEEVRGDFAGDNGLQKGLKALQEKMNITEQCNVITCVSGKQLYVAQIPFRKLPVEEMKPALALEIRKNLPFDIAGTTMDYQILEKKGKMNKKNEKSEGNENEIQVLVVVVVNTLLTRYVNNFVAAGVCGPIIDALPAVMSNAFHACVDLHTRGGDGQAFVLLHVGSGNCTLVIDGVDVPFFNRNIFVALDEMVERRTGDPIANATELKRRLDALSDEVVRSISYYQESFAILVAPEIFLIGDYIDETGLRDAIAAKTGVKISVLDVCSQLNYIKKPLPGKFEIAVALALRT